MTFMEFLVADGILFILGSASLVVAWRKDGKAAIAGFGGFGVMFVLLIVVIVLFARTLHA